MDRVWIVLDHNYNILSLRKTANSALEVARKIWPEGIEYPPNGVYEEGECIFIEAATSHSKQLGFVHCHAILD